MRSQFLVRSTKYG